MRARYGEVHALGGTEIPLNERFFVGGINTMRGFAFGRAGPVVPTTRAPFGAAKQLIFNTELIFTISAEAKLNGVLFFDYGKGFDDGEPLSFDLRPAAGLEGAGSLPSVRCVWPMGLILTREPVSVSVCSNLQSEPCFSRSIDVMSLNANRRRTRLWYTEWMGLLSVVAMTFTLGGCAGSVSRVDGKVGVINSQRLLNDTNAGKRAKESLTAYSKNRQALMELEERELRRMEEDFVKQSSILSPAAKRDREEQFRRRMQEYQQKAAELNREVQEKQKDVLEGFRDRIETVVAKVAKRLGLQVVVDKSKGGPTIYHEEGLDISSEVIEEFNREYP